MAPMKFFIFLSSFLSLNFFACCLTQDLLVAYKAPDNEGMVFNVDSTPSAAPRKWISQIFEEVQQNFHMYSNVSDRCKEDFHLYEMFLENQSIWAVRMMESSEWPRLGLFAGHTTMVGGWTECLRARSPAYQGQYCLVDAVYDYTFAEADPVVPGWDRYPNENASVWGAMKLYETIITRIPRRNLTWALCIPSSCSAADLQNSVTLAAEPVFHKYDMSISVNVDAKNCRVQQSKPFSKGFYYTMAFVFLLLGAVTLATFFDYKAHYAPSETKLEKVIEEEETSYVMKVIYAFSALESWKSLTKASASTIHVLYFFKTLSFVLILVAHNGTLAIPFPKIEQERAEMMYQPWQIAFGFHGVVDFFLAFSGFLTFHFGYEPTKKAALIYSFAAIIFRWIRLIPVMGLFILIYIYVAPEIGDGPLWNKRMIYDIDCCESNWWTNMLTIQNIVNKENICMPHTWYIAIDFQLTLVGTAILIILAKNFTLGLIFMFLTFVLGVSTHFYQIYSNHYSGLPLPALFEMSETRKLSIFSDIYIQMHSRVSAYIVGCAGALLLRTLKDKKFYPSIMLSLMIQCTIAFVGFGSQLYGFLLVMLGRRYDPLENAAFGAIQRPVIALPMISATIFMELRRMGYLTDILSWKIFLIFGRLAYCMYLTSYTIQYFRFSSMRQIIIGSGELDIAYSVMTDICLVVIASFFLFGLAEGPLHNLTKLLQLEIYKKMQSSGKKQSNAVRRKYEDIIA